MSDKWWCPWQSYTQRWVRAGKGETIGYNAPVSSLQEASENSQYWSFEVGILVKKPAATSGHPTVEAKDQMAWRQDYPLVL